MLQLFVGAKTVLITSTHVLHLTALATGKSVIKIVKCVSLREVYQGTDSSILKRFVSRQNK
jgi:hypothetical protein